MAVSNTAIITGGSFYINTDCDATASAVKASSCVLYEVQIDNSLNAAATYVKMWNNAAPTVGTTVPDAIFLAPAGATVVGCFPSGMTFGTALAVAGLTTGGTAGTTNPTSNVTVRLVYV